MHGTEKLKTIDELGALLKGLREEGKKVVLCHGCFDLLHPGHIRHFQGAKQLGDILVVTVTPDRFVDKGPGRPVYNETLRAGSVAAMECVDFVAINEWPTAEETLRILRPHYYVKGQEFQESGDATGKLDREKDVLREINAEIRFTHDITFSSTKLLNEQFGLLSDELLDFLAPLRCQSLAQEVTKVLDQIRDLKIVVLGDAIIDEYHFVQTLNVSSKSAMLSTRFLNAMSGIGGALCIANHLSSFCQYVQVITCLGEGDSKNGQIRALLDDSVDLKAFKRPDGPTTVKRRYVSNDLKEKLFEVQFLNDDPVPLSVEQAVLEGLRKTLPDIDLVIVADYGHGLMTAGIIQAVSELSPYIALTVQTNSANYGFNCITKYPRADYAAINEREVRLACHDRVGSLDGLVPILMKNLGVSSFICTLGRQGARVYTQDAEPISVPVLTQVFMDTVGAGDALFALTAPLSYLGVEPILTAILGNAAGAFASNVVGNSAAIRPGEFRKFVNGLVS